MNQAVRWLVFGWGLVVSLVVSVLLIAAKNSIERDERVEAKVTYLEWIVAALREEVQVHDHPTFVSGVDPAAHEHDWAHDHRLTGNYIVSHEHGPQRQTHFHPVEVVKDEVQRHDHSPEELPPSVAAWCAKARFTNAQRRFPNGSCCPIRLSRICRFGCPKRDSISRGCRAPKAKTARRGNHWRSRHDAR